jgi:hypothetical protein
VKDLLRHDQPADTLVDEDTSLRSVWQLVLKVLSHNIGTMINGFYDIEKR